jgi:hypothetical protein
MAIFYFVKFFAHFIFGGCQVSVHQLTRGRVGISEAVGLDELHAASMWATWTCRLMPLVSITAPQKQLDWPLASCVGSLHAESHIAYFHAVQARRFRYSSKSASVRLARKTSYANSKSPRASSKLAAVPDVQSPGCEPG